MNAKLNLWTLQGFAEVILVSFFRFVMYWAVGSVSVNVKLNLRYFKDN